MIPTNPSGMAKLQTKVNRNPDVGLALWKAACDGHMLRFKSAMRKMRGKHPDVKYRGATPLYMAAFNGHFDIMKMLVHKGANPLKDCVWDEEQGASPFNPCEVGRLYGWLSEDEVLELCKTHAKL